jgi:short-subunit dehydrogenase
MIIGASSGIGAQLAVDLAACGYSVGLVARRGDLLDAVAALLPTRAFTQVTDLKNTEQARTDVLALIAEMGGVDLFVISAGVGFENPDLAWTPEADTIAVNVVGFACLVNVVSEHFMARGSGHLVGISSLAAIRGNGAAPAYGASKAFASNYLQAMRHRFARSGLPVFITDVQAGFVDTDMAKGDGLFWVAPVQKVSRQILGAIQKKKSHVYVTRRWRIVAWLLRLAPNWLYDKL